MTQRRDTIGPMTRIRLLCCFACAAAELAMFRPPSVAPVERIIANNTEYLKTNPQDPEGYYALARTHYLAYALNTKRLEYFPSTPDGVAAARPFNVFSHGKAVPHS